MQIISNIIIIILELIGLRKRSGGFEWKMFVYYTQLSNAVALMASAIFLVTAGSVAAVYLRYLASVMLIMTAFVTACILVPMGGGLRKMLFSGSGLYHHTLCPILSVISYIFWEPHVTSPYAWLLPSFVTLAYGIILMMMNWLRKVDGPYPFFRVHNQSRLATVAWTIVLFGAISFFAILLNRMAGFVKNQI